MFAQNNFKLRQSAFIHLVGWFVSEQDFSCYYHTRQSQQMPSEKCLGMYARTTEMVCTQIYIVWIIIILERVSILAYTKKVIELYLISFTSIIQPSKMKRLLQNSLLNSFGFGFQFFYFIILPENFIDKQQKLNIFFLFKSTSFFSLNRFYLVFTVESRICMIMWKPTNDIYWIYILLIYSCDLQWFIFVCISFWQFHHSRNQWVFFRHFSVSWKKLVLICKVQTFWWWKMWFCSPMYLSCRISQNTHLFCV